MRLTALLMAALAAGAALAQNVAICAGTTVASTLYACTEHVLLGNSFLTRFQMKRKNDKLTLDERP